MDKSEIEAMFGTLSPEGLAELNAQMTQAGDDLLKVGIDALPEEMRESARTPGSPLNVMLVSAVRMISSAMMTLMVSMIEHGAKEYEMSASARARFVEQLRAKVAAKSNPGG